MEISKDTMLDKMLKEIHAAKSAPSTEEVTTSMSHIKLLCELWLDEYQKQGNDQEQAVMKGATISPTYRQEPQESNDQTMQQQMLTEAHKEVSKEKDDFSIFDF